MLEVEGLTSVLPDHPKAEPCPSCQENGTPTGLEFWWLSRPCSVQIVYPEECAGAPDVDHSKCTSCDGTGRVPLSEAEQGWALLEYMQKKATIYIDGTEIEPGTLSKGVTVVWGDPDYDEPWKLERIGGSKGATTNNLLGALASAIRQSLEVEGG